MELTSWNGNLNKKPIREILDTIAAGERLTCNPDRGGVPLNTGGSWQAGTSPPCTPVVDRELQVVDTILY